MTLFKLDETSVMKQLTKSPLSAVELATKMKLKGASSYARIRAVLAGLVEKKLVAVDLRRGQRGRPATVYSKR